MNIGALLPKWPSETFLRELAGFAAKNTWEGAKVFFPSEIKARIARPRSRKSPVLTIRDLVKEGEEPTWVKRRITEVEDEEESSTLSQICSGRAVVSVTPAAASVVSMTPEVLPLASPPRCCCCSYSLPVFLCSCVSSPQTSSTEDPNQKNKSDGKNRGSGKENKKRQDSSHESRRTQEVQRDGKRSGKGRGRSKAKGYKLCPEGPDVDRGGGWGGK